MNHQCFIIAEAGVNHNGDIDTALTLVDAAAKAGADAVKFQTFHADKLVRSGTKTADYQRSNTGQVDQKEMLRRLELSLEAHEAIRDRCLEIGTIEFMSTPFDEDSATMLVKMGMRRIKIPSGELTNVRLLPHVAAMNIPLILSTGMASMKEVCEAVELIDRTRLEHGFRETLGSILTLLHCTSNYPTSLDDVNLRAMAAMRDHFGLSVGYSDHTDGILIPIAASALGASVLEKHFTLSRKMEGPDHKSSLEPEELATMVRQIRQVELCLGDGEKLPRANEIPVRDLVRRSVVAARDIPAQKTITNDDLELLRPGTGIQPRDLIKLVGRRTRAVIAKGAMLKWENLE